MQRNGYHLSPRIFNRYRIDPTKLEINPSDSTFSTNTGFDDFAVVLPSGLDFIPAGWAEFQPTQSNDGPAAEASVDLEGTGFAFDPSILENSLEDFFCSVTTGSPDEDGEGSTVTVASDLTSFTLTGINSNQANAPNGVSTRKVAACDQLGASATTFDSAKWPLQYIETTE